MKHDIRQIEALAERLSPEERQRMNEEEVRRVKDEYARFLEAYAKNACYLCNTSLDERNPRELCPHWLLQPKGIKGRDIARVLTKFGYFRTQAFLRWLANQDGIARNINDLEGERDESKILETTITFRDLEWTFGFGKSDLEGHDTSAHAEAPHFHFQMRRSGRVVFGFSDHHCPFTDYDLFKVEIIRNQSRKIMHRFTFGEGMDDLLAPEMSDKIIGEAKTPNSPDEAAVRIQTVLMSEDGSGIPMDEINAILQEAREKDVPIASLLHKLKAKTKHTTVITPAESVPEIAHRKKNRGKKRKSQQRPERDK